MEWLQNLLDNSSIPVITAFLLGLLTAVSPCPLATNITAIGYIGRNIENRQIVLRNGLLYTFGRILSYTILGIILLLILREGASLFPVQKWLATYGEMIIGPALLLIGLFMLFGDKLHLPKFGFGGNVEKIAKRGGLGALLLGALFALAFCPTSGVFYFGALIPLSASTEGGFLLPAVFAVATALPVLIIAFLLAFSVENVGKFYGKVTTFQKWLNSIVGLLFVAIGAYYLLLIFF
ncbi:MAG: sulfite exporter TauE/SafE family protein [Paludibacteraceae bacterium]|jgi:cytochrome c biogenesis protein CcdA|nr:sulfite exporter TauE/SafE family protein [Saprospiraceae bacterium]MBP9039044.1 sulfite exporter TauE/SafE family protein [Paludibacteraceae bacterium]HHT61642.1 sulfite exporter TauE/SafE family protein [Bacteroidales bacterium]